MKSCAQGSDLENDLKLRLEFARKICGKSAMCNNEIRNHQKKTRC